MEMYGLTRGAYNLELTWDGDLIRKMQNWKGADIKEQLSSYPEDF